MDASRRNCKVTSMCSGEVRVPTSWYGRIFIHSPLVLDETSMDLEEENNMLVGMSLSTSSLKNRFKNKLGMKNEITADKMHQTTYPGVYTRFTSLGEELSVQRKDPSIQGMQ